MKLYFYLFALAAVTMADETGVERYLSEGNTQFTAKLFTEVVKQHPDKSVVLSAFSVLQPLAQLALASVGASHDEILKTIGIPNDNVTKEVFPLVNGKLRSVKGVELKMANKVYIPKGYELNTDFAAVSREAFGSEVKNVDFTDSVNTAQEINTWVEDQTNHRIKNLVDPKNLNANTRAVLVNALYFKGTWKDKFDESSTTDRDFHVSKDKTIKVPTMFKNGHFRYGESEELDAKLLELPYEGDESSFLVVLPNKIDGLAALEEKLKDPTALDKAVQGMFTTEVDVFLPKFKIETTTDLKEALLNIGVEKLFLPTEARLDNLLKNAQALFVSDAVQKAFIEVNEEGAEAAAANEFDSYNRVLFVTPPPKKFLVDRPFYFALRGNDKTLFNGALLRL